MSEPLDVKAQRIVTRLPDLELQALMQAGAQELIVRRLVLPNHLGSLGELAIGDALRAPESGPTTTLADGRLVVIHADRRAVIDGVTQKLPGKEHGILSILGKNADTIVDRYSILETVWPDISASTLTQAQQKHLVDPIMSRIRSRLGRDDLGHRTNGVIRNFYREGWMAVTSLHEK